MDHLLQDEGAAGGGSFLLRARERLGETLWQFDLWPTYRVIALPIVEIEEKSGALLEVGRRKKKGVVGDESMSARARAALSLLPASFFRDCWSIIILPVLLPLQTPRGEKHRYLRYLLFSLSRSDTLI